MMPLHSRPKSVHSRIDPSLAKIHHQRSSTAIVQVGQVRVVRIFVDCEKGKGGSNWKTIQIPTPCSASFCRELLRMKPTIKHSTTEKYRLVEVHGVTDIRVLEDEDDICSVIDSWSSEAKQNEKLTITFKDPTNMKKVLRVFLEDDMMKTIAVGYDMTAQNICSVLARKMKLIDTSAYRLILLTVEDLTQQRVIKHSENMFALISELKEKGTDYTVYFRDPLTPIRKGDMEVISVPYVIPELPRFEVISLLGQGGFGKVWKVRDLTSGDILALKVMRKFMVVEREMILHTNIELQMMQDLQHPFIVKLYHSAQTEERLYMAMEYLEGGSLFDLIRNSRTAFSEDAARFYAAQIVLALEELHNKKFVYRDLKLENILLDAAGNLRLTDFGLSHFDPTGNGVKSFSGTAIYLAPEILNNQAHGKSVDFWCFGVAMFLLLCQEPPFWHENHKELFEEIKTKEPYWEDHTHLSDAASDLLHSLLKKNPAERLGCNGMEEVKTHPYFATTDWEQVLNKQISPPFPPTVLDRNSVCIPKDDLNDIFIDTQEHSFIEPEYFSNFSFCATVEEAE
uniref:Protein kinase domain-containing protein n=1 Tax=Vannella robusta TaxID=1487602 RepID=A0A7S4MLV8_9EUKA